MLDQSHPKIPRSYKLSVLGVFLLCFVFYLHFKNCSSSLPRCLDDRLHTYFLPVNSILRNSKTWRTILTLISQCVIDFWFLFITVFWVGKVQNSRFPSSVAIFYLIRARFLQIEKFPFPKGIIWQNPGLWSITVAYDHTRDFFFSGHTGILTIIFCELYTTKKQTSAIFCLLSLLYTIFILLSTQVHYTVDVFGGFITAFYIHNLLEQYVFYCDWILSIPWLLGQKLEQCATGSFV